MQKSRPGKPLAHVPDSEGVDLRIDTPLMQEAPGGYKLENEPLLSEQGIEAFPKPGGKVPLPHPVPGRVDPKEGLIFLHRPLFLHPFTGEGPNHLGTTLLQRTGK
jgi:hypothetical protein